MAEYTLTLPDGIESRVFIEPSLQGARAYGIMFDACANTVGEAEHSQQYIGYCRDCIIARVTLAMMPELDDSVVWESLGGSCACW